MLGVAATSLWIVDHDGERLRLHSARGFGDQFFADFADGLPLSAPHDVVRAFNTAAPVVHEDVAASAVAAPVKEAYARYGIALGALVALPLRSPAGLVGGLTLAWSEPRFFTAGERAFDLLLADTFAIALENARLFEAEAESRRHAEALNAIDRLVHSTLDFDEIMQRALDEGVRVLAVETGAIEMREKSCWMVRYQHGFADADIGLCLRDSEAPNATRLERSGEFLAIADMRADPAADVGFVHRYGLRSLLAVPLVSQAVVIGCLLFYGNDVRMFSDSEIDFARKLGATVSLACENARLVQAEVDARAETQRELETTELLLEAAGSLGRSLAVADVLDSLARVILAAGGHTRVTFSLWQEHSGRLLVASPLGEPSVQTGLLVALDEISAPARRAIAERTSAVIDYDALEPGQRGTRDGVTSHLALNVPLYFGDRFVGLLATDDPGERREFSAREVSLIEGIGAQAAVAIENARLYEQQQNIATTLQENLRHPLPSIAGLELGTVSQTAFEPELVGGDFSDVFVLADGRVAILIGDVAGKGVPAAGLTETVRSTVRAFATIDSSPAFVLRKTSEALLRYETDEPHVTAFFVVLDPGTGQLGFASAGHPAPIHLGPHHCRPLEVAFGPPLGTFAVDYAATDGTLTHEDYLVLYTDGVTEARRDDELFGETRLIEAVTDLRGRSAQEPANGVRDAALTFGGRLKDDLHIVTLRLC